MKFAAFISIIVSLAVMIGACQGAVGKAGKDGVGATGATGATGVTGETGPAGAASFGLRLNVPTVTFKVIPAGTSETKKSIPLSNYYRGGQGEVEFDYPEPNTAPADFTAMLSMDKQNLELAVIADTEGFANNSFMVTATDGDGIVLTIDVVARRNQAPISATEKITPALVIGTQPDPAKTPTIPAKGACTASSPTYNKCKLAYSDIVATNQGTMTIQVDDHDEVTFTAVASSDSSKATAEIVDKGKSIVVTGVASTNTIDGTDDTDKPVTITITASDDGGLTGTTTIDVTVDGAPKLRAGGIRDQTIKVASGVSLLSGVSAFFTDDKAATTTFTVAAVGMGTEIVASKSETGVLSGLTVSGQDITVDADNEGLAVVKVTVSDEGGQTAYGEFNVTVTR